MADNEEKKSNGGCLRPLLGWLILLAAVALVLFYLVFKPKWEAEGVDVNTKIEEWKVEAKQAGEKVADKTKEGIQVVREKAPEVVERAKNVWQGGKEKTGEITEEVKEKIEEKTEEIKEESSEWVD